MKYLISETTREEREQIVEKALAISLTGADAPSEETLMLVQSYIDGDIELDEIKKILVNKYKEDE